MLDSPERKKKARVLIDNCGSDPVMRLTVEPHRRDRSVQQNALYWKWLTIIAGEIGTTKDELHMEYKRRHLVPIFTRDDEGYAAMVEAVKSVRAKGMRAQADTLRNKIVDLTSTTDCTTAQMAEYMGEIEKEAAGLNIVLPRPEEMGYDEGILKATGKIKKGKQ